MFHIDSVENTKHLDNVLDYITENGRNTWIGDVTVALGRVKFSEIWNLKNSSG